ncbi:PfkB family carbohydrate kinase [Microbacterium sp. PA5]|uniref:PfkB family carbohydrate kinase n=1 Tax=Microbacterium sp. PA5 TaxID=3416654 RepID=UPI003CF97EE4
MSGGFHPDVLVVGEALIDIVEAGASVTESVGGSPTNVALGLGRLGYRTALLTQLADDDRGAAIRAHLRASGVAILPESYSLEETSTARALIRDHGQAAYDFAITWGPLPHVDRIRPRVLHTGSLATFLAPGAAGVRRMVGDCEAEYITFDPNIRPAVLGATDLFDTFIQVAGRATVVKLSDEDADWLYPNATIDEVIDDLLGRGVGVVAVTKGSEGAILSTRRARVSVAAPITRVVDTIGAGDTFMTSLIDSLLSGVLEDGHRGDDERALMRAGTAAVRAAAITVSRRGADLPWRRELQPFAARAGRPASA